MPSHEFFELLAACIKEDGPELVRNSLEHVTGPSNEEFFGNIVLSSLKEEIKNRIKEKNTVCFEKQATYESCLNVNMDIPYYYHCNDNNELLSMAA